MKGRQAQARGRRSVLAAVSAVSGLVLAATGGPVPMAQAAPAALAGQAVEPVVTLSAAAARVWEDRAVRLAGVVTDQGAPAGGVTVGLWWSPAGAGSWAPLAQGVVTDAAGAYAADVSWPDPAGAVEIVARAETNGVEGHSLPVPLVVDDRQVGLDAMPSTRVVADRPIASGAVVPAEAGVAVSVVYELPGRAAATAAAQTDASGRFTVELPASASIGRLGVQATTGGPGADLETATLSSTVRAEFVSATRPVTRRMVRYSYRPGCPVGPRSLVAVRMIYRTYRDTYRWGEMIMARGAQDDILSAFETAFDNGFRIRRMVPVERYKGSDPAAMRANNTSAFNCRHVTGDPFSLSPHAYGSAVDINTVQNPYQDARGRWWPSANKWLDRGRSHPGMIKSASPVRLEFARRGFQWGGLWAHKDWQHFDPR